MRNTLIAHFKDHIDVGIFSNSSQSIQILSIYIQPSSNPSDAILNNIFGKMSFWPEILMYTIWHERPPNVI